MPVNYSDIGLVLAGGGARCAYQAGVLRAVAEILGNPEQIPFRHLVGASAGAINITHLAGHAEHFTTAVTHMLDHWAGIHSSDVFHTDFSSLAKLGFLWAKDLMLGAIKKESHIRYLLDTTPLRKLLHDTLLMEGVSRNLQSHHIDSICITCMNYPEMATVHFVQARNTFTHWKRHRRYSRSETITLDHILASCAIPIFFPPVAINGVFFGDGSVRNFAPLNPAIHLGAQKIFIIGVRNYRNEATFDCNLKPSIGRQLSVLLNSIFLDTVDSDLERLHLYNGLAERIDNEKHVPLRKIHDFFIYPSQDISSIAFEHHAVLPANIHYLLQGLGSLQESAALISYLFFEPAYSARLIDLGYHDAKRRSDEIKRFFFEA